MSLMNQDPTIHRILQRALEQHQAGDFAEAAKAYEQILKLDPNHADSLHLLGMAAYQVGRPDMAVPLIQRAIEVNGREASYRSNLGTIFQSQGLLAQAEAEYTRALELNPKQAETLGNLGSVLLAQGTLDKAVGCYRRALALKPSMAELHFHLGHALQLKGDLQKAVFCYEKALELKPNYAEAHSNLGSTFTALKKPERAAGHYRHALAIHPNLVEAHNGLGVALFAQDQYEQAIQHYERALALKPDYAEAHSNYGTLLETEGKLEEAVQRHERALVLKPDYAEAHNSLGNALGYLGRSDEAIAHFQRALALKPELTEAYYNMGMVQLGAGDLLSGWRNYEWRWLSERSFLTKREFAQPRWNGEPLNGARILIHAEQGLGDTLQFLRYLPMVKAAGGTVILAIQERLLRLAKEISAVEEVVASGAPLPSFDWHCPLLSLPLVFGTTLETIPVQMPYLRVPEQAQRKMDSLPWPTEGLRVGFVWRGNPSYLRNRARYRSLPFLSWKPLLGVKGIHLFSLQLGEGIAELAEVSGAIIDLSPYVDDMADTAAQMAHLDLVIAVDTSVAHLAGALGIATWVLLPSAADWRWMQNRRESPWYPSMRLFRQPRPGDWQSVIEEVRECLLKERDRLTPPARHTGSPAH